MEPILVDDGGVEGDADDFRDLLEAAQYALGFWDNTLDDQEWRAVQ